jgi:hypothetical protein
MQGFTMGVDAEVAIAAVTFIFQELNAGRTSTETQDFSTLLSNC